VAVSLNVGAILIALTQGIQHDNLLQGLIRAPLLFGVYFLPGNLLASLIRNSLTTKPQRDEYNRQTGGT
jgi:hypothetical protein